MKKKRPELRFSGFDNDWEQRKLLDVAPLQRGFDLPASQMKEGKYPVVMSNGIGGYHSEYKVKGPGIITGRSGTIGELHYIEENYWPHNTALWVTDFKGNYSKFIFHLYRMIDLSHYETGSGVPTLNRNDVHDAKVFVPRVEEQRCVAVLLDSLDHLITLHRCECTKLICIKKSMLENMFPQKGEKIPRIRFSGFTDDWEQRKLSQMVEIIGGGTPSTNNPDYWDGDIDWYAPAEIGEQIYANGSVRKITKEGLSHSSAKILPAHKTVLFTSRAGIGNMAILQRSAATNQGFQSLICGDDTTPYFVFSMGNTIKAKAERIAAGSTFSEISGKKLGELEFMFPALAEQQKIGEYFNRLDNLITLHQRKLGKLQNIKKAMLEKMFV